ncbi:hypothetical protein [Lentilactobacillus kribbianus]|uniref:hypothetical protein n=1 Tax=Lentilactobacillus kribbianus TaxID=2729622 RepID=UPI001552DD03|nr:hypothetical protein [Lentilactobacillus kribbianus]
MSNKSEILQEFVAACDKLDELKSKEAENSSPSTKETVVIQPQFGGEMNELTRKCDQLNMILAAMDASED